MKGDIYQRACNLAEYIISTNGTVRQAAKEFGVSKSTVHKDICERLPEINRSLYAKARKVLGINKEERHIRGGNATREKWEKTNPHLCV